MLNELKWPIRAQGIQAIVASVAILIAGGWALYVYFQTREGFPKAEVRHSVERISLTGQQSLLRLTVTILNRGKTLIRISSGNLRVNQILPLAACANSVSFCPRDEIAAGNRPVPSSQLTVPWPEVAYTEIGEDRYIRMEPGEDFTLHADVLIDTTLELLEFYSFFRNDSVGDNVGWVTKTLHDLNSLEDPR